MAQIFNPQCSCALVAQVFARCIFADTACCPDPKTHSMSAAFIARSAALIEGVFSRSPVVHGDHSDSPVFLPDATERYKLVAMGAEEYLPATLPRRVNSLSTLNAYQPKAVYFARKHPRGVSGQAARAGGTTT
jgi:hypothetical protein